MYNFGEDTLEMVMSDSVQLVVHELLLFHDVIYISLKILDSVKLCSFYHS
jgi:hypothetical protein